MQQAVNHTWSARLSLCAGVLTTALFLAGCSRSAGPAEPLAEVKRQSPVSGLNLNTASVSELEKLPGVGPQLAARVVAYRQSYGPLRRAEEVILVRGFSEHRFRRIQLYVRAE